MGKCLHPGDWAQYTEHQIRFLTVEAPLWWFLITCWVAVKSHAQPCPTPFTDVIYIFVLMSFDKTWPEVFQQKIGYILLLPGNKQRVCQDCIDFLTVWGKTGFLSTSFSSGHPPMKHCRFKHLLSLRILKGKCTDQAVHFPELTPQNSDVQVTWEILWILPRNHNMVKFCESCPTVVMGLNSMDCSVLIIFLKWCSRNIWSFLWHNCTRFLFHTLLPLSLKGISPSLHHCPAQEAFHWRPLTWLFCSSPWTFSSKWFVQE